MEFLWALKSCEERKYHPTFLRRVCATTSHPTHPAIIFRLRRLTSPTSERERCHPGPRRPITAGPIYDPSFPGKKYKKGKKKNPPSPFLFRTHQRKMEEAISDIRSAGEGEKAQKRQLYTADRGGGGNGSIFYFSPKSCVQKSPIDKRALLCKLHLEKFALCFCSIVQKVKCKNALCCLSFEIHSR